MSKGLGKLERSIINELQKIDTTEWRAASAYGFCFLLPPNVYDLYEIKWTIARQTDNTDNGYIVDFRRMLLHDPVKSNNGCYISTSFEASFSRSVRSLIKKGYIVKASSFEMIDCEWYKSCYSHQPRWEQVIIKFGRYYLGYYNKTRFIIYKGLTLS